jgi:hypothetical protein
MFGENDMLYRSSGVGYGDFVVVRVYFRVQDVSL